MQGSSWKSTIFTIRGHSPVVNQIQSPRVVHSISHLWQPLSCFLPIALMFAVEHDSTTHHSCWLEFQLWRNGEHYEFCLLSSWLLIQNFLVFDCIPIYRLCLFLARLVLFEWHIVNAGKRVTMGRRTAIDWTNKKLCCRVWNSSLELAWTSSEIWILSLLSCLKTKWLSTRKEQKSKFKSYLRPPNRLTYSMQYESSQGKGLANTYCSFQSCLSNDSNSCIFTKIGCRWESSLVMHSELGSFGGRG